MNISEQEKNRIRGLHKNHSIIKEQTPSPGIDPDSIPHPIQGGGPTIDPDVEAYVEPDYEGYYVGDDEETEVYHLDEPEFLKAVKYWCDQGGPTENLPITSNAWVESANLLSQAEAYCNTL